MLINNFLGKLAILSLAGTGQLLGTAQASTLTESTFSTRAADLQIDQAVIRSSPVLQRWLDQPPDVLHEIDSTPSFPTRLSLAFLTTPSRDGDNTWQASVQDIFVADSSLSLSTEYGQSFTTDNRQWGASARVYLLPLGSHLNVAPVFGYHQVVVDGLTFQGPEVGTRWVLAAPQAADISFVQTFVLSERGGTVGRSQLAFSYALSPLLRLSMQFQWQNSTVRWDQSYGLALELVGN